MYNMHPFIMSMRYINWSLYIILRIASIPLLFSRDINRTYEVTLFNIFTNQNDTSRFTWIETSCEFEVGNITKWKMTLYLIIIYKNICDERSFKLVSVWIYVSSVHVHALLFFFFFGTCFRSKHVCYDYYSLIIVATFNYSPVYCSWVSQTSLFSHFFIKNGSYGTIHILKNYFTTVFSVFNFSKINSI